MTSISQTDFISLAEEEFDFDVSLSPVSGEEEGDEVFLGRVSHKEKSISVGGVETLVRKDTSSGYSLGEEPSWSPLAGDKFGEIFKEAHLLAKQIERSNDGEPTAQVVTKSAVDKALVKERFLEDPRAKLSAFGKPADPALSPIKRKTFCVKDSPMKRLPPAIQQRLLKDGRAASGPPTKRSTSTSSPAKVCKAQPASTLRSKAGFSYTKAGVLPNRHVVPGGAQLSTKTRLALPDTGKPERKHSPSGRNLSSAGSSEDLHSDTASVASDISDSSFNASLPGRRAIPGPRKSGLQRPPAVKAPALQNRRIAERKNTSSSSSSVSSMNSSLSISPSGKGKMNSSLNSGLSRMKARGPPSVGTPTAGRLSCSGVGAAKGRTSCVLNRAPEPLAATRKPAESRPRLMKSTSVRKPEPFPMQTTPKRAMELPRSGSVPSLPTTSAMADSAVKGNPKTKGIVGPTPTSQLKGPRPSEFPSPGAPRIMKPKRLMSACSVESLLQKPVVSAPEVFQTPRGRATSAASVSRTGRSTALPTPVSRRVSGIPKLTPRPSQTTELADLPTSTQKPGLGSPALGKMAQQERALVSGDVPSEEPLSALLQPRSLVFSLEEDSAESPLTAPLPSRPEDSSEHAKELPLEQEHSLGEQGGTLNGDLPRPGEQGGTLNGDLPRPGEQGGTLNGDLPRPGEQGGTLNGDLPRPGEQGGTLNGDLPRPGEQGGTLNGDLACPAEPLPPNSTKTPENEVLLVDAPAPVLRADERLLIDLSNTPDLIKTAPSKPSGGQLIDLSSPLITWSPMDKKENATDAVPLINLSF